MGRCNERIYWNQEQYQVVFNDKSSFCLWVHGGRKRMGRYREERRNLNLPLEHQTALTQGMMIAYNTRSPLVFIPSNVKSKDTETDNPNFQHGSARVTSQYFFDMNCLQMCPLFNTSRT